MTSLMKFSDVPKERQMNVVNEKIKHCNRCFVDQSLRVRTYGRGSLNSKIIIVGESPYMKRQWMDLSQAQLDAEIKRRYGNRTSFGDRAGKLLTDMLYAAGINELADVYVSNIVNCSLLENAKPTLHEVKNCIGYLESEISIIDPQIILAASKAARNWFKVDIDGHIKVDGKIAVGIYHPAVCLHRANMFYGCVEQLKNVKKRWLK